MPSVLATQHCQPVARGTSPLDQAAIAELLPQLPQWALADDHTALRREFRFRDFYATMAFVNAVAWIAHAEDHHPDLELGYAHCTVRYRTHAVGGVSINDLICAAKVDALLP